MAKDGDNSVNPDPPSLYKPELLPKNKFDTEAVEHLMKIPSHDLEPLVDDLIQWIADYCWPIAPPLHPVLLRVPWALVCAISNVLLMHVWSGHDAGQIIVDETHDHQLHCRVLDDLVVHLPTECLWHLKDDLELYLETMVTPETDEAYDFTATINGILAWLR